MDSIFPKIMLAPLAGVTDQSFRSIAFDLGAEGAITEMVSIKGLDYNDPRTASYLHVGDREGFVGLQLFGHEPEVFKRVLEEKLQDTAFSFIDINMGCPAPKIVKNGDGSALMRQPEKVEKLLKTVVEASPLPVTVKMRLGWNEQERNYLKIAKIAEYVGVSAVTLHGRTREMFYSGQADWNAIKQLANTLSIPVYGNGDIFSAEKALERLKNFDCYGIMIGRGALGNPWIFQEIQARIKKEDWTLPKKSEIYRIINLHYKKVVEDKGERVGLLQMRKHAAWYLKGIPGNGKIRAEINRSLSIDEIRNILKEFLL